MTLSEFKAWREGFNEAINGAPNKEQWEVIKDKLIQVWPDIIDRGPYIAAATPYVPFDPPYSPCGDSISRLLIMHHTKCH